MKDNMKSCQHTLSEDSVYKEVVVIGNGPSGMVTSFMLAGNVPYLKDIPEDLPIDEMLRARLSNLPQGQSLYEADLLALAEGLEGRSQNPIPLLMDNLMRPCADLGIQADPLIEWKYDVEKEIDHIVLGRGPPGGAWHTFPPTVRTLSPAAWLSLPPHSPSDASRLSARAMAHYCRRYVPACGLQKYFRSGVIVTSVARAPHSQSGVRCPDQRCPLNARFYVSGYEKSDGRSFRYACRRVVVACGGGDRPNTLASPVASHAVHSLAAVERAVHALSAQGGSRAALVVGSGVSAADALRLCRRGGRGPALRVHHVHRAPASALATLHPDAYPDYHQIYKMMCDGPSGNHPNYTPYPEHVILEVTPTNKRTDKLTDEDDLAIRPKRVKLLNLVTNQTTEIEVSLIAVFIGSKPDLFFLQTNYLDCITQIECPNCITKRNDDKQCFLKNRWHYLKSILGQSIQICKSRYLSSELNGNDTECVIPECKKRDIISYDSKKCSCDGLNPFSSGIGFGLDPTKPVDGRNNPIAIDKSSHEVLNSPEGIYALGPLTADNFVRFIPGGALAIVADLHKKQ